MRQKLGSGRPSHATVVAYLALFVALGGTTYAATGGNFILGQANTANAPTTLSSGTTGPAFKVSSTTTLAGATALGLNVASGHTPFTVNSGTKVTNLNADKLDGLDSTSFISASTLRRFNFQASMPPVFAHSCSDGTLSGLNLRNNHLLLTPESESEQGLLEYSVLYKSSAGGDAILRACNPYNVNVDQPSTTRFNLVAISP